MRNKEVDALKVDEELEIVEEHPDGVIMTTLIIKRAKEGYLLSVLQYEHDQLRRAKRLGPFPKDYIIELLRINSEKLFSK